VYRKQQTRLAVASFDQLNVVGVVMAVLTVVASTGQPTINNNIHSLHSSSAYTQTIQRDRDNTDVVCTDRLASSADSAMKKP